MNDDQTQERQLAETLRSLDFAPSGDDQDFIGGVRQRVRVRKRNRAVVRGVAASLTAVLLVLAIFRSAEWLQGSQVPLLENNEWTATGLTEDELTSLSDNMDQILFPDQGDDQDLQQLTSDLSLLFEQEFIYDPVDYLADYDDNLQDRVLDQLENLDILNGTGSSAMAEREEI